MVSFLPSRHRIRRGAQRGCIWLDDKEPVGCRNSSAPNTNRRTRFEFAPFADDGMLSPMKSSCQNSANPLIVKVRQLFSRDLALENDYLRLCFRLPTASISRDLALENDYLRQENRILRTKLGARVSLTEADRRVLVKCGLRTKNRLRAARWGAVLRGQWLWRGGQERLCLERLEPAVILFCQADNQSFGVAGFARTSGLGRGIAVPELLEQAQVVAGDEKPLVAVG
jgi:hypothetical protein